MKIPNAAQLVAAAIVASVLSACADAPTSSPTAKTLGPNLDINLPPVIDLAANITLTEEKIVVCKVFAGSQLSYPSASFAVTLTGTYNTTVNFSLNDGYCADLGGFGGDGVDASVTETPIANYSTQYTTQLVTSTGGVRTVGPISSPTTGYTATGSAFGSRTGQVATGTRFVFTNTYVPPPGCTFTQGYWKTHSEFGPAPYDATWASLPGGLGASTVFFLSGQTWIQVFNTAPGGNAYYQLADQYMAAQLNVLHGSSVPASVQTALNSSTTLFNTYTPAQIGALKGSSTLRQQFVSLAGTLGSYNEGTTGPGHCGA